MHIYLKIFMTHSFFEKKMYFSRFDMMLFFFHGFDKHLVILNRSLKTWEDT